MRNKIVLSLFGIVALCGIAIADLDPYADYDLSDAVWSVSTIRVDANMGDAYLEGIKNTWAAGNEIALKLGQIESYSIFRSNLPDSGDFNLLLIVKYANTSDMAPNKARYEAPTHPIWRPTKHVTRLSWLSGVRKRRMRAPSTPRKTIRVCALSLVNT